jgi:hypothetical protein
MFEDTMINLLKWFCLQLGIIRDKPSFRPKPKGMVSCVQKGSFYCGKQDLTGRGAFVEIVLEQPPQSRTIFCRPGRYFLSFPYTVFIIRLMKFRDAYTNKFGYSLYSFKVGFRDKPLSSQDDYIGQLPLSNYDKGFGVCLGVLPVHVKECEDMNEIVTNLVSYFWQSVFTMMSKDLCERWQRAKSPPDYVNGRSLNELCAVNPVFSRTLQS